LPAFPMVAPAATFLLTPPAMYFVTKFHLRGVSAPARIATGLRLAVLVTVVQLPLDALGLLSVRQLGLPELDLSAQQATVLALQAGYFWMLLIPWWASARPSSK
jgi:hypothetical protein